MSLSYISCLMLIEKIKAKEKNNISPIMERFFWSLCFLVLSFEQNPNFYMKVETGQTPLDIYIYILINNPTWDLRTLFHVSIGSWEFKHYLDRSKYGHPYIFLDNCSLLPIFFSPPLDMVLVKSSHIIWFWIRSLNFAIYICFPILEICNTWCFCVRFYTWFSKVLVNV